MQVLINRVLFDEETPDSGSWISTSNTFRLHSAPFHYCSRRGEGNREDDNMEVDEEDQEYWLKYDDVEANQENSAYYRGHETLAPAALFY